MNDSLPPHEQSGDPQTAGEPASSVLDLPAGLEGRYLPAMPGMPLGRGTTGQSSFLATVEEPAVARWVLRRLEGHVPVDASRFRRDVEALGRLQHPALAPLDSLHIEGERIWLLRDYVDGVDFLSFVSRPPSPQEEELVQQRLRESTPGELPAVEFEEEEAPADGAPSSPQATQANAEGEEALLSERFRATDLDVVFLRLEQLLPQLIAGLEHLHRFRKVHGNLVSQNILVDLEGRLRITDFGLLSLLQSEVGPEGSAGTPPSGDAAAVVPLARAASVLPSTSADLHALGCLLYQAITGREPAQRAALAAVAPHCPAAWVELVQRLVEPSESRRATMADVAALMADLERRTVSVPASAVPERDVLLGRSDLLEGLLEDARQAAHKRQLSVAMIEGATGVGKSTLLDALAWRAAQQGWLVLRGRCFSRESIIYQGWEEIARELAAICRTLPEHTRQKLAPIQRRAATLFPILEPQRAHEGLAGSEPPRISRLEAVGSFRKLMARVAEERPLLLCMDDVHAAGWDTSALIADIIAWPSSWRAMMVMSWCTDTARRDDHLLLRDLPSVPTTVQRVVLSAFSKVEAREFVRHSATGLSSQTKADVLRHGEFHPLLLEELIHDSRHAQAEPTSARRALVAREDAEESPGTQTSGIAQRIQRVLRQRLHQLSRPERLALQVLAVASGPLRQSVIRTVIASEFGPTRVAADVDRPVLAHLCAMRLAREVVTGAGEPAEGQAAFVVFNDVCRTLVLSETGRDHHAHLCSLIADALSHDTEDFEDLRFEYLLRAGRLEDADDAAVRAARLATHRFASHRAAKLWRWVCEHPDEDAAHATDPWLELALAEQQAGRYEAARDLFEKIAKRPDARHQSASARAAALGRLGLAQWQCGQLQAMGNSMAQSLDAASGATLRLLPPGPLRRLGLRLDAALRRTARLQERHERTRNLPVGDGAAGEMRPTWQFAHLSMPLVDTRLVPVVHRALSRKSRREADADLLVWDALHLLEELRSPVLMSAPLRAASLLEQCAALASASASADTRALVALARARVHLADGRYGATEEALEEARKLLRKSRDEHGLVHAAIYDTLAWLALGRGQLAQAGELAAFVAHSHRHNHMFLPLAWMVQLELAVLRGQIDGMGELIERMQQALRPGPTSELHVWLLVQTARWHVAHGRPEVAVAQLDVALEDLHERAMLGLAHVDLLVHLTLGQALASWLHRARQLDPHHTRQLLRRLQALADRLLQGMPKASFDVQGQIVRLAACASLLAGRPRRALRHLERAPLAAGSPPEALEEARRLEARAVVLAALDRAESRALWEQVRQIWNRLGCQFPLILEGWPVPRLATSLAED